MPTHTQTNVLYTILLYERIKTTYVRPWFIESLSTNRDLYVIPPATDRGGDVRLGFRYAARRRRPRRPRNSVFIAYAVFIRPCPSGPRSLAAAVSGTSFAIGYIVIRRKTFAAPFNFELFRGCYSTRVHPDEKLFPSIRGRVVVQVGSKEIDLYVG